MRLFTWLLAVVATPAAAAILTTYVSSQLKGTRTEKDVSVWNCEPYPGQRKRWSPLPMEEHAVDINKVFCEEAEGGGARQLPQLYLLGAMKAGTTSVALDMIQAGMKCFNNQKESKFFPKILSKSLKDAKKYMVEHSPACDTTKRQIVTEMTPWNLFAVPSTARRADGDGLPAFLQRMYSPNQLKHLVFVVVLREPLARMQSDYYMVLNGDAAVRKSVNNKSFKDLVDYSITSMGRNATMLTAVDEAFDRRVNFTLMKSQYARQLADWTMKFSPSQFVIIVSEQYQADARAACKVVSTAVSYSLDCRNAKQRVQVNHREHNSLDRDLPRETREAFRALMRKDYENLVKLLANMHAGGAKIVGYKGKSEASAVGPWLRALWYAKSR